MLNALVAVAQVETNILRYLKKSKPKKFKLAIVAV